MQFVGVNSPPSRLRSMLHSCVHPAFTMAHAPEPAPRPYGPALQPAGTPFAPQAIAPPPAPPGRACGSGSSHRIWCSGRLGRWSNQWGRPRSEENLGWAQKMGMQALGGGVSKTAGVSQQFATCALTQALAGGWAGSSCLCQVGATNTV